MNRDDLPPDGDDPDRAAILARRKRFIAIALSGLASGVGCAQPCLNVSRPGDEENEQKADTVPPEACLKVAAPADTQKPDAPTDPTKNPPTDTAKPNPNDPVKPPAPEPCLKVAAPPTTTKEPEPMACLNVAMPDPEDKPRPEPCLRVARPPDDKARPTPCLKVARPRDDK